METPSEEEASAMLIELEVYSLFCGGGGLAQGAKSLFKNTLNKSLSSPRIGHRLFTKNRKNGTWNTGKFRFGWSGRNGQDTYKLMFRYKEKHIPTGINTKRPPPKR